MMPKGYWIARVDVTNDTGYKNYVAANAVAFAKFGGKFIVRGGSYTAVEGTARSRNVVIEFGSYKMAIDCYRSPEYTTAAALRKNAGISDLVIVEGYDGPQPGSVT